MPIKKRITLGDILAHIRSVVGRIDMLETRLTARMDGLEWKFNGLEQKFDAMDQRLGRIETSLKPAHERLQITVRDHGNRIRKLERGRLVAA